MMEELFFEKLIRDRKILQEEQIVQARELKGRYKKTLWEAILSEGWLQEKDVEKILQEVRLFLKNPSASVETAPPKENKRASSPALPPLAEQIQCPQCEKTFGVPKFILAQGKPLQCPNCPHVFRPEDVRPPGDLEKSPSPSRDSKGPEPAEKPSSITELRKPQEEREVSSSPSKESNGEESKKLVIENLPRDTPVGKYRILRKLGEGARGIVYQAEQISMKRNVAIKFLRPGLFSSSGELVEDFKDLLSLWGSLHNPQIIKIIDMGTLGQTLYYVMPFQEGISLDQLLKGKIFSEKKALQMIRDIAEVVGSLHKKGLIHFCLAPTNIFLSPEEELILADLSLASFANKISSVYTPPELKRNPPPSHFSSDIYSLGIIFQQILSRTEEGNLRRFLKPITARMTTQNHKERYPDIPDLMKDLDHPPEETPPETKPPNPPGMAPPEALLTVIFAIIVFTALSMILFLFLKIVF